MTIKQLIIQVIVGLCLLAAAFFGVPYVWAEVLPAGWLGEWYGMGVFMTMSLGFGFGLVAGGALLVDGAVEALSKGLE